MQFGAVYRLAQCLPATEQSVVGETHTKGGNAAQRGVACSVPQKHQQSAHFWRSTLMRAIAFSLARALPTMLACGVRAANSL